MRYLTAKQMREADRRCIDEIGIPGAVLMNNAGAAVFREIDRGPVGLVCGKGNNGGDGYVVARLALLAGFETRVVLLCSPEEVRGDALVFLNAYRRLGGQFFAPSLDNVAEAVGALADCAYLVDAILGTGVSGEVRGPARTAIEAWPDPSALRHAQGERIASAARPEPFALSVSKGGPITIAVDLPSGLDADTGQICGACIKAHTTVTFQFPKKGFEDPAARPYIGRLVVADIGIPEVCADDAAWAELRSTVLHSSPGPHQP